jgi:hypothetical protein
VNLDEETLALKDKELELRLIFEESTRRDLKYYTVDWPKNKPLVVATLDTFDSGNHVRVRRVVTDFIRANFPRGHAIYFAVASEKESTHEAMKRILHSRGDSSQILTATTSSRSRLGKIFSSQRREARVRVLVASTHTDGVLDDLFRTYFHEWYMESIIPFIVSIEEPLHWQSQLGNLTRPRNRAVVSRETVQSSYCLITTMWEHGLIFLSDKVTRPDLAKTTDRIAEANGLKLSIETRGASEANLIAPN